MCKKTFFNTLPKCWFSAKARKRLLCVKNVTSCDIVLYGVTLCRQRMNDVVQYDLFLLVIFTLKNNKYEKDICQWSLFRKEKRTELPLCKRRNGNSEWSLRFCLRCGRRRYQARTETCRLWLGLRCRRQVIPASLNLRLCRNSEFTAERWSELAERRPFRAGCALVREPRALSGVHAKGLWPKHAAFGVGRWL